MSEPGARNPIVVAVLFALSGALTYFLLRSWDPGFYIGGVTFALVAVILFVRPSWTWLLMIVLIDAVWIAAWRSAVFLITNEGWNPYLGMLPSGVLGGLGVTAAIGIGRRNLWSMPSLAAVAVAGAIASLPFGWWEQKNTDSELLWCFAIWQCVTGLAVWVCASRAPAVVQPKAA